MSLTCVREWHFIRVIYYYYYVNKPSLLLSFSFFNSHICKAMLFTITSELVGFYWPVNHAVVSRQQHATNMDKDYLSHYNTNQTYHPHSCKAVKCLVHNLHLTIPTTEAVSLISSPYISVLCTVTIIFRMYCFRAQHSNVI